MTHTDTVGNILGEEFQIKPIPVVMIDWRGNRIQDAIRCS
jgi:hypothetical protein